MDAPEFLSHFNNRPSDVASSGTLPKLATFQMIGTCACGVMLQTTLLQHVEEPDLWGIGTGSTLLEAQITCGRCQRSYRYITQEEP